MDLPIELWIRVFEHIDHKPHKTRAFAIEKWLSDSNSGKENIALPSFEKGIWKSARSYHRINQASHNAASMIDLSTNLLRSCKLVDTILDVDRAFRSFQKSTATANVDSNMCK